MIPEDIQAILDEAGWTPYKPPRVPFPSVYTLAASCGDCGSDLDYVTGGDSKARPGRELACLVRCQNCHHYWVLRVELLRAPADAAATERARVSRRKARRSAEANGAVAA